MAAPLPPLAFPFPVEALYADETLGPPDAWEWSAHWPAPPATTVRAYVEGAMAGLQDYVVCATRALAEAAYDRALAAYPWRERARLEAAVPALVTDAVAKVASGAVPAILRGDVDALLPPVGALVRTTGERHAVASDLHAHLGDRPPLSRLEVYETLYALVVAGERVSPASRALFHRVFAC